jgi:tripartite-type tricarboxylate transporter receptor subunit TctC
MIRPFTGGCTIGLEIAPPARRTPEYLAKFVPEEIAHWSKVIRAAGIVPN